ncbi:hypothetical protein IW140_001080 [Coemansia sp. RSA 1813]|nr:hypothetical protein EV178_002307 [Coemansia sp. RSA 1646]KAJ1773113.1 hypothetical protein LPJ74_000852 [Coemansia sp. RSA 1843]KAJ2091990.1 hypothetical protein IW138_001356 [Coemansia sp. RSA 986]KAJ2216673.1 hypothetical protein EV179_001212 [Coemansia sp. RSA 487]KAJ2572040.1 hypothetical protein IW140_001080 [Coemansia sp. RSA 1813]
MSDTIAAVETEAQKRRRLRQERIMNRGGDRLSRIKSTLNKVQEENSDSEIAMAGGHELITAADRSPSISEPSTVDAEVGATSAKPQRRVGNLARKAKLEADDESSDLRSSGGDSAPGSARERNKRRTRAAIQAADINSDALHDTVIAAIADPAAELPRFLPSAPSSSSLPSSFSSDESGALGGMLAQRQFSAIGLSRSIARMVPVISIYLYGLRREANHEHLMSDNEDDIRAKWTSLMNTRPDSHLDEWANGSHLLWYAIVLELVLFAAYFILSDGRRQRRTPLSLIAQIPGVPSWTSDLVSAGNRVVDSMSILLFFTALSILSTR